MWKDKPQGTKEDHWIDLIWQDGSEEEDRWMEAAVKWDGCIHFNKAGNIPFSKEYGESEDKKRESHGACDDYIHICDIDQFINILIELKKKAQDHFKNHDEWKDKVNE